MAKPPLKSPEDKARVVVSILRGEVTIAEASRREGVSQTTIAKWRDRFLDGGQAAVAAGGRVGSSREQRLTAQIEELTSALGEAHMELRLWRKGGLFTRLRRARRGTAGCQHDGHRVLCTSRYSSFVVVSVADGGHRNQGAVAGPRPRMWSKSTPRPWPATGTGGGTANSPS